MAAKKKAKKAKTAPEPKKKHAPRAAAVPASKSKKAPPQKKAAPAPPKRRPAAPARESLPAIGASEHPLVVRTDFSDPETWAAIREIIAQPVDDGFLANVEYLEDRAYGGVTAERLLEALDEGYTHSFIIVADREAMEHPDQALLVIDLDADRGRELRAVPGQIQSIENNLSLSNMEFEEFAEAVEDDGVFRGF